MRCPLFNPDTDRLTYGIREIVELAGRIERLDPRFVFVGENIGDPVAKGWAVPPFVRRIVAGLARTDSGVYGYAHSRGRADTRRWIAEQARRLAPACRLDPDHVVMTNGLGAAISVFYRTLRRGARILQPRPGYPAHSSTEQFAARAPSLGYRCDPQRGWAPDLEDLERQVRRHPEAAGILLINPNNPTGAVYDAATLEAVIRLAERHHLLLVSDEVYFRMVREPVRYVHITQLAAGRVPLVVMRGMSKDVPWPGGRCGWMEFHHTDLDPDYRRFYESLLRPLMLEVCATALPQAALPLIYDHPEYARWLRRYTAELERNGQAIAGHLNQTPGVSAQPPRGAFYIMAQIEPRRLRPGQSLPIAQPAVRAFIRRAVSARRLPLDKRLAYFLLGATGICVVPASDFNAPGPGFRVTTLDRDPAHRDRTYRVLSRAIARYLDSN